MNVKCYDLSDQRDRLQVAVSEMDDCRNQNEQSLLQVQVLQEELQNCKINMDKLQHELDLSDDGLDCTASNKKTEQSIAHNNENAIMPESVTSVLHAVINNENETVINSDELGIGLGPR
ncbi:hypothetical protein EVAR_92643_1 [Eumeta japonica]|uniref:Uncharacterized protein n=1 Tax=Eumeta variegata TaxID=151549 RepID=A0A4C1T0A9_EUMVA|nr:hypothetical protein EVAR_92643_1 [Eumeta japonica]